MNIKIELSEKSIKNAIDQINKYAKSLESKNDLVVKRLIEHGYLVARQNAQGGRDLYNVTQGISTYEQYDVNVMKGNHETRGGVSTAVVMADGKDILWLEFGTGVHFNSKPSPHPMGAELGMTIGGYGKGNGNFDSWTFVDDNGDYIVCKGNKAQMPMYKASVSMLLQAISIIQGVYKT